jgi:hypothetical protein
MIRVTRLGDFLHMGGCFFFGPISENHRTSPDFWAAYSYGKSNVLILTKIGRATFWTIFSQTHVFTLYILI